METLFTADSVTFPVTEGHTTLKSLKFSAADEDDDYYFPGFRLDADRPPMKLRYAQDFLYWEKKTVSEKLPRNAAITPDLYRKIANPVIADCIPFGNECTYSASMWFDRLEISPSSEFSDFDVHSREYYQFSDNRLELVTLADGSKKMRVRQTDKTKTPVESDQRSQRMDGMQFVVYVDKVKPGDMEPKTVTAKLRLCQRPYSLHDYMDVTCSVDYKVELPQATLSMFARDLSSRADKVCNLFAYSASVPYDGVFYNFRIELRHDNRAKAASLPTTEDDDDDDDDDDALFDAVCGGLPDGAKVYELYIECADRIKFDVFGRIASALFDYFAYQHRTNKGVIDDFTCDNDVWFDEYRTSVKDQVRSSLDCMISGTSEHKQMVPELDDFNDLVTYLCLKNMTKLAGPEASKEFEDMGKAFGPRFDNFQPN